MLSYDFFKDFFPTSATLDDHYKVLQTIGEGRYAKVKLAIDLQNRKKYAIKIMREDQVNTPNKLETFFNEVRILTSTLNKHVVQIVHVSLDGEYRKPNGSVHKVVYYVMKYAEYGELFEILQQFETFPERIARYYFHQLIQSVEYLHSNGIGHRDIKTENILIDHKFDLKLADFGCACRIRDHKSQRVRFDNQVPIGSPEYNAPEIMNADLHKHYYAEDADVFASASALFVMMLKSIPFNSSLFSDPYYSRLCKKDTSQFWKIFDPNALLSSDFKDLIERMMQPNPSNRISIKEIQKHPWYLGPLPHIEEVENEMISKTEAVRAANMEKLRQCHSRRLRKHQGSQSETKSFMSHNIPTVEVQDLKSALRVSVMEINAKLKQDNEELKLGKMMDRLSAHAQAQVAKNKKEFSKDKKAAKVQRKSRNSEIKTSDKPSIPDYEGPKFTKKQSRSFEEDLPGNVSEKGQTKVVGSGTPSPKEDRIRVRRSGSDD